MVETFREAGDGESSRPTPAGDFDGTTRVDAMRGLMLANRADRKQRLLKRLRRPLLERIGKAMAMMAWAGIIWTGPKLTPQEAADVLRPNQYVASTCDRCDGPYVASTGTEVQMLTADYRAALLRRGTESTSRGIVLSQGWTSYDRLALRHTGLPAMRPYSVRPSTLTR